MHSLAKQICCQQPGECTLSITVVQAPGTGEQERVAVDYFTKDIAVDNILRHQKT